MIVWFLNAFLHHVQIWLDLISRWVAVYRYHFRLHFNTLIWRNYILRIPCRLSCWITSWHMYSLWSNSMSNGQFMKSPSLILKILVILWIFAFLISADSIASFYIMVDVTISKESDQFQHNCIHVPLITSSLQNAAMVEYAYLLTNRV
jgi:hypothetical protein